MGIKHKDIAVYIETSKEIIDWMYGAKNLGREEDNGQQIDEEAAQELQKE